MPKIILGDKNHLEAAHTVTITVTDEFLAEIDEDNKAIFGVNLVDLIQRLLADRMVVLPKPGLVMPAKDTGGQDA